MWIVHKQLFVAAVLSVEFLALLALTGQTKAHVIFFFLQFHIAMKSTVNVWYLPPGSRYEIPSSL